LLLGWANTIVKIINMFPELDDISFY
jgi:hypothetical protein